MKTRFVVVLAAVAVVVGLTVGASAAAADAHSGTWKQNAEKSKYSPGPAPRSVIVKIEADDKQIKLKADVVNADGTEQHVSYTAEFDGKDHPVTGVPNVDSVSVKRLKGGAIESQQKKGGQVLVTITSVVSKDGKTRTSTWKGKDAQGRDVNNVVVFDKQ